MNKQMKAILIMLMIWWCTLSLGVNVSGTKETRSVIYVNNDNINGPWNGSQLYPYRHIQDALNHALAGDFISVANGTYYEHLTINSSLTGLTINKWTNPPSEHDTNPPTLYGNDTGTGINIKASDVTIALITINHYGQEGRDTDIYIDKGVDSVSIHNCTLNSSYCGIWIKRDLPYDSYHQIKYNIISNMSSRGISMILSDYVMIISNKIAHCGIGAYLHDCNHCIISGNNFSFCTNPTYGTGLALDIGFLNSVLHNTFCQNTFGLGTVGTRSSIIQSNNFIDNKNTPAYFITFDIYSGDAWSNNYYKGSHNLLLKLIGGHFVFAKITLPWIKFDFFPSRDPN